MLSWGAATLWWLVAGALVAAELISGTFYLLMLALGAAAAALGAHAGLGSVAQLALAALAGGGAVVGWTLWRGRRTAPAADALNLDIGATVTVLQWQADGTARVHHRGSDWTAAWAGDGPPAPGVHVVRALQANRLLLERAETH